MSEVIEYSTQHMVDEDLRAIAIYLKDMDGEEGRAPAEPEEAVMNAGAAIYFDNCSACHVLRRHGRAALLRSACRIRKGQQ
ncbi:MAG: cytochrome c [Chitinophagaceae bacterium]|nr:cytochrome c [Chitinophagaceae bacterium]